MGRVLLDKTLRRAQWELLDAAPLQDLGRAVGGVSYGAEGCPLTALMVASVSKTGNGKSTQKMQRA
jgi:hypothetical protein